MRLLRFILILSSIAVAGCNSGKEKITIKNKDGSKATIDLEGIKDITALADEPVDKSVDLKKLTPLTLDQLKALIPDEFMGMKRNSFSANSMMGTAFCQAKYKGENDKEVNLNIYDCAGEAGAGIYSLRFWTLMNFEQEDDNGYQKTVDFNGQKALEKYSKYNERYSLTYLAADRFLVNIEGEKISLDVLKQAANKLKLKSD